MSQQTRSDVFAWAMALATFVVGYNTLVLLR